MAPPSTVLRARDAGLRLTAVQRGTPDALPGRTVSTAAVPGGL
ncbi:hypothetical protein [Streptomyces sp. NPDC001536]